MPAFGYKISGPATIYSDHPMEPLRQLTSVNAPSPVSPTLSYHAKKTVAFAQECAVAFAKDCIEWNKRATNQPRAKDDNLLCDFNSDTKQYFVHASVELHAPLADVLEVFATSNPDADPFFARVFDGAIEVSNVAQHVGDPVEGGDWRDAAPSSSTNKVASTTRIKRMRFLNKPWKKELLCLEHIEALTPTCIVRFYESVDGWVDVEGRARTSSLDSWTQERDRHQNLTFGFLFEKISRANRLRLSFLGYHSTLASSTSSETCKWLEKVGASLGMLKKVVLRRRLAQDAPVKSVASTKAVDPTASLPRACHQCRKSFHLFRKAHFCQACQVAVCSKCMRREDSEAPNGLVTPMQVCFACAKAMRDQYKSPPPSVLVPAASRRRTRSSNNQTSSSLPQLYQPPLTSESDEETDFQTRRQVQGAAMIPAFRSTSSHPNLHGSRKPSHPARLPPPAARRNVPKPCSRCAGHIPSIGLCGACSHAFCGACSVIEKVQVGPNNVFELQLCHNCVSKSLVGGETESRSSSMTQPDPIYIRPSSSSERMSFDPEAMMRTMTFGRDHAIRFDLLEQDVAPPPILKSIPVLEGLDVDDDDDTRVSSAVVATDDNQLGLDDDDQSQSLTREVSLEEQLQMFACLDLGANALHDALCADACTALECANAYVTLIYQGAYVLKGAYGPTVPSQIPTTCAFVKEVLHESLLLVPDASADPRFVASPRVTGPESIRFFCGLPLVTSDGHCLGTVAVADTAPRLRISAHHRSAIEAFHDRVLTLVEDRLALALQHNEDRLSDELLDG
ncbi:Aste57867_3663 [Aphanomyces stellatus]|uniref:Aste57867_3663 protein n=1 Tax=Aphanomyces stellatus TaxID=120398 RepID=A0A485KA49_9STRA|nr:hypothetical protein As57867_003652 [Aphanomyces stellatus]VFT80818.1 Aste57867_3663 [Aphanomyces stellatus]